MKTRNIYILFLILLIAVSVSGQMQGTIISPELHKDNKVTFRISAPEATKAILSGSCMDCDQSLEIMNLLKITKGYGALLLIRWLLNTIPILLP